MHTTVMVTLTDCRDDAKKASYDLLCMSCVTFVGLCVHTRGSPICLQAHRLLAGVMLPAILAEAARMAHIASKHLLGRSAAHLSTAGEVSGLSQPSVLV